MPRISYANPPVHEVVLSLGLHEGLAEAELDHLPATIGPRFSRTDRLEQTQAEISVGPVGDPAVSSQRRFDGWLFKHDDGRLLRAGPSQVSYHVVRPGKWPSGAYPGWEIIGPDWLELLGLLAPAYQLAPIRRAGLRYLNRIAIPEDADPSEWFAFMLRVPRMLRDPYSFNLGQTWARVEGHERLSANVRMVKIKIEVPEYAKGNQGVLLDIEVFNLYVKDAPRFEDLSEWFDEAHAVENRIFEECISDALRERFNQVGQGVQ